MLDNHQYPRGISVVIPCLNEEATVGNCVREAVVQLKITDLPFEVIVVDNGSSDRSANVAAHEGALIVQCHSRGYGKAIDAGIRHARYQAVVIADADGSYRFDMIERLVAPILEERADFVLGSRLNGEMEEGSMPMLHRYVGTPVLSCLIRILFGIPVTDSNSGMRSFARGRYEEMGLSCTGMEICSEMLIAVAKKGLRYEEVPIRFSKDLRGRPSHLRPWLDGMRNVKVILGGIVGLHIGSLRWSLSMVAYYLIATLLFLFPSLVSGFPFYNGDSYGYLNVALSPINAGPPRRAIGYSALMMITALPFNTLWLVVALQSFLCAFVVHCIWKVFAPQRAQSLWHKLIIVVFLTLASSLSWDAGTLLPDVFAPLVCLSYYLLMYCSSTLSKMEKGGLMIVFSCGIATHFSHVVIALTLFSLSIAYMYWRRRFPQKQAFVSVLLALVVSIGGLALWNWYLIGRATVSGDGHVWYVSRMVDDGIVAQMLSERCDLSHYALCARREWFSQWHYGSAYIWDSTSPFYSIGAWADSGEEHNRLIRDSFRYYPWLQLFKMVENTVKLFFTSIYLEQFKWVDASLVQWFREHWSFEIRELAMSVQSKFCLDKGFEVNHSYAFGMIRQFLKWAGYLSLLLCTLIALPFVKLKQISRPIRLFAQVTLYFLAVNAAVCGVLSGYFSRYQTRMMWLPTLVVLIAASAVVAKNRGDDCT